MSDATKTPRPLVEIHEDALILCGLTEAMDALADQIGPRGLALWACINQAVPLARKVADDLESIM